MDWKKGRESMGPELDQERGYADPTRPQPAKTGAELRMNVLFVEASEADVDLAVDQLQRGGFTLALRESVQTREALTRALLRERWDLVIGDFSLPTLHGLEALALVREIHPDLPYIMISGGKGEEMAVAAMKAGANDYLTKGNLHRLAPAVSREIREFKEKQGTLEALRRSEEQLRLAQRLETVGRLAGGVAHDFNNILSVVSGYASLLQMKLAKAGTAHRELIEIERAVLKATALVGQLLAFSRKQVVHAQVLDLGQLSRECMPMIRIIVGEDIELECRLEEDLGRVKVDRSQIEQAIMNLVANAKDAMPKGGSLYLGLQEVQLDTGHFRQGEKAVPGAYLALTIRDSGSGMDPETLSRIFEPFFTTKGEGRGTGLGLSTVYGIVQHAGGNIRVVSGINAGTTFTLYLPRAAAPASGDEAAVPLRIRSSPSRGETILLVEDDVDLRKLTKDILVLEGYRVLEPASSQDALGFARASEIKIDMLLTDLVMPRMNGRDLAEAVLSLRPDMDVVYMSGYAPDPHLPEMNLISELNFLEKPFTPVKLLAKVRATLDAHKA